MKILYKVHAIERYKNKNGESKTVKHTIGVIHDVDGVLHLKLNYQPQQEFILEKYENKKQGE